MVCRRAREAWWLRRTAGAAIPAAALGMVLTAPAPPAFAAGLASPAWLASDTAPGAAGVSYTYTFTTASTSVLDSITMTVPAGTGGTPAVGKVTPATVAAGASVSLAGDTLTYSFTPAA